MKRSVADRDLRLEDAEEFQVAMTCDDRALIDAWLNGDHAPAVPERGILCVVTRSAGTRRLTYLVHEVVTPEANDVTFEGGVRFHRDYRQRVKEKADDLGGGLMYLHTHWGGDGTPSRQDVDVSRRQLHNDAQHLDHENPPLASGIVTEGGRWMVLGHEFPAGTSISDTEPRYTSAIRLVGDRFTKLPTNTEDEVTGAAGATGHWDADTQDRQVRLWGEDAQRMYGGLRVAIVGVGGGGSILAEHVARAGVAELVLIDFDVIKAENLNRQQGATEVDADVWTPKVDVAARVARRAATNPGFAVETVPRSVVEDDPDYSGHRHLLDCDVILHAADGHFTNWVLDDVAYAHLIPVISGGTRPETTDDGVLTDVSKSPITVAGPGHPCLECARQWNASKAKKQRAGGGPLPGEYGFEDDEAGVADDNEPAPAVISLNSIVAGMMHLRLQDLVLGVTGHKVGVKRFRPGAWDIQLGRDSCRSACSRPDRTATGEAHTMPLSKDYEFEKLRKEVQGRSLPYW